MTANPGNPGENWCASRLLGRPVVHLDRVICVGQVADVAFDPERRLLAGILVGPPGAEGVLFDALRRAVGGSLGLTFVALDHIVALDGDVVMISPERRQRPDASAHAFPRLRAARGLSVITAEGRRLGRFVDLLLDPEGRSLAGYLIEPAPGSAAAQHPATPNPQTAPTDARAPEPHLIPASAHVRVGRDLIAVGEPPRPGSRIIPARPARPSGQPAEWPVAPPDPWAPGLLDVPDPHRAAEPAHDAPTEELRRHA